VVKSKTVDRKIEFKTYIIVGVLTLLVFSLGLALGIIMENERGKSLEKASKEQELNYMSLQFQHLYITTLQNESSSCPAFKATLRNSIRDLSDSLVRLENYKAESNFNKEEFDRLSRVYILDNLKYWLFAKKTKDLCDMDLVTILYFFSTKHCSKCPDQGVILTYFKKIFSDRLLIFPIDTDMEKDERAITLLKIRYNITRYPSLVLGDEVDSYIVSKNELNTLICQAFNTEQEECKNI
jgi:hypothetical protein